MTDTSNADASPDAQPSQLSGRGQAAKQLLDDWTRQAQQTTAPSGPIPYGVWQRGRDQPTTVAGGAPQPQQPPQPLQPPPPPNPLASTWQPGPKTPYSRLNAFPPGTRLPSPPAIQPYSMPFPNRDVSQWGQAPPYPSLPQTFEMPGIFQNLSQHYGSTGMPSLSVPGLLMQIFSNAHQKAAMQGQLEQMKLMKEQLDLNNAQLEENDQRRLIDYSDILSRYEAAANQTDPDKLGQHALGGMDVRTALEQKAGELQDKGLGDLLASGAPMSRIVQYLQSHEAKWRALHAANKKSQEDSAGDALWDQTPGADGTSATPDGATTTAGGATAGAPTGATGIQEGLPNLTLHPVDAATPTPTPEGAPTEPTDPSRRSPMQQAIIQGVQGSVDTTGMSNARKTELGLGINKVNAQLAGIADDPSLVGKQDEIDKKLKAIAPEIANDVHRVRTYATPVGGGATSGTGGQKMAAYRQLLENLAKAEDPSWDSGKYKIVNDFRELAQKPQSPIQRIPTAAINARNALDDLRAIQDRNIKQGLDKNSIDIDKLQMGDSSAASLSALFGRDAIYGKYKQDLLRMQEDIDVLNRGSPSVGMTAEALHLTPVTSSIAENYGVIQGAMREAYKRAQAWHHTWDQYHTEEEMPGTDKDMERDMQAMGNLETMHGMTPREERFIQGQWIKYTGNAKNPYQIDPDKPPPDGDDGVPQPNP